VEFTFPFLSPAWMGVALVGALLVATLVPESWRRTWVVAAGGSGAASAAALAGLVPWTGQLHATAYALCMVAAFVAAYAATLPRARLLGIPERQLLDLFLLGLVGGIVGARLGEMWEQWPGFAQLPGGRRMPWGDLLAKAADIDSGGMVWYGGALVGGAFMVLYGWRARLRFLVLADLILPSTLLGLGLGRVGCFFNGCCYGRPTTLPWGIRSPAGPCTHPTQLYETAACLVLAAGLIALWYRRRSQGQVALAAVLGYAAWRFLNESLRGDTVMTTFWGLFPVTTSQALSLDLALAASVAAVAIGLRRRRDAEARRLAADVPGSRHQPRPPAAAHAAP
jgi:phosphatidylglycerol:prolipoprotein diacylglycerol transferase